MVSEHLQKAEEDRFPILRDPNGLKKEEKKEVTQPLIESSREIYEDLIDQFFDHRISKLDLIMKMDSPSPIERH